PVSGEVEIKPTKTGETAPSLGEAIIPEDQFDPDNEENPIHDTEPDNGPTLCQGVANWLDHFWTSPGWVEPARGELSAPPSFGTPPLSIGVPTDVPPVGPILEPVWTWLGSGGGVPIPAAVF